jgi:hypothetical protein
MSGASQTPVHNKRYAKYLFPFFSLQVPGVKYFDCIQQSLTSFGILSELHSQEEKPFEGNSSKHARC